MHNLPTELTKQQLNVTSDPRIALLGGIDPAGLDGLLPGGIYAVAPQSPPARFPLWAAMLRGAIQAGGVCHVLVRVDPDEFISRIQSAGWNGINVAWEQGNLRIYPMAEGFTKLLFRMDVEALTSELEHWGVASGNLLLVDAGDEMLSLHDLTLATTQLLKLKDWTKRTRVVALFNFSLFNAATGLSALAPLMDHLFGIARLHSDVDGPLLNLSYWQSEVGTAAERIVRLGMEPSGALKLRGADHAANADSALPPDRSELASGFKLAQPVQPFVDDQVWALELQMLTGWTWLSLGDRVELIEAVLSASKPLVVLRFGTEQPLVDLAKTVHSLRSQGGSSLRIVVAEHRASLRYTNELLLLRMGADAIIRKDVPLQRWPDVLVGLHSQPPRPKPDMEVLGALASAATPQNKGYVTVPNFVAEVDSAIERGNVLGVPFAIAALRPRGDRAIADIVDSANFRRNGDFLTTDGRGLYILLNACSLTRAQEVLDGLFGNKLLNHALGIDWMGSEFDVKRLMLDVQKHYAEHPFQPITRRSIDIPVHLVGLSDLSDEDVDQNAKSDQSIQVPDPQVPALVTNDDWPLAQPSEPTLVVAVDSKELRSEPAKVSEKQLLHAAPPSLVSITPASIDVSRSDGIGQGEAVASEKSAPFKPDAASDHKPPEGAALGMPPPLQGEAVADVHLASRVNEPLRAQHASQPARITVRQSVPAECHSSMANRALPLHVRPGAGVLVTAAPDHSRGVERDRSTVDATPKQVSVRQKRTHGYF